MLRAGDLIDYPENMECRARLIWMDDCGTQGAIILVEDAQALPQLVEVQKLTDDIASGRARLMLQDPYVVFAADAKLKASHAAIRDQAWRWIEDLVTRVPDIFVAHRRARMVRAVVEGGRWFEDKATEEKPDGQNGVTRVTLYKYLRRYWQKGMTPNALLPTYDKCGGKGKERASDGTKRGRARKYGEKKGLNITEDIRRVFRVGISRCYASDRKRKWTLKDVFGDIIKNFFSHKRVDAETGRELFVEKEEFKETGGPTYEQFLYWVNKDHSRLDIKRKRLGAKMYDKDLRGLLGTSNAEVMGPGDRYQIDATIADLYLVSRLNKHRIIGRPVLYVVIDVFSRMIVGIYVGLEGPSWVGAMMALANTAMDKVEYCRALGITIDEDDWPCHFLPGALLGDRGEIESHHIEALINNFNVRVENAASYRADWKGIVEQRFHLLSAKFKKYTPGYIEPDFRQRGARDYRLDAVLDLDDFLRIIIECVLAYNNHHELTTYDKDRDVAADEVPAIPRELWEWGMHHRSGALRAFPQELVQFSLLPVDEATVTTHGIYFKGCYYTCVKAMEERWFDQARQTKRWKVPISYDPRDRDIIYLHEAGKKLAFEVCTLTDRSRA